MDVKNVERIMMFLELAEQGSFTKATQKLGISKGYMSKQIKTLEEELKTKLVIRSTRHMRLTAEGQRAYNHGLKIKHQIHAFRDNVQEENEQLSGLLRLTAPKMFTEAFLTDICYEFKQQHPDIRFELNSSFTKYNLIQDNIDLAIRATNTPPDNLVAHKLFSYRHILVASPHYLSNLGSPENEDDLLDHNCLTTLHQQNWPLKSSDPHVSGWLTTNENHVLKQQAMQGKGLVRMPSYYVRQEIEQGELEEVLSEQNSGQTNTFYLLYPQPVYPPAKLTTFIEFVKSYFEHSKYAFD
ncbi:LysR family transcriptional regulator [Vibrio tubiashii]|uniref:LysR family transcriptional regulator n=1 Tax=Vibrio tubiashii TaxID=29498 RepID=UPI00349E4CD3